MRRYPSDLIPSEYRNPTENVWLIPCWDAVRNIEIIDIPDDWIYPLPDLGDSLSILDPPSIMGDYNYPEAT